MRRGDGRILLGDNTGGRASLDFNWASSNMHVYGLTKSILSSDLRQILWNVTFANVGERLCALTENSLLFCIEGFLDLVRPKLTLLLRTKK